VATGDWPAAVALCCVANAILALEALSTCCFMCEWCACCGGIGTRLPVGDGRRTVQYTVLYALLGAAAGLTCRRGRSSVVAVVVSS
jgi:hypothetical protein